MSIIGTEVEHPQFGRGQVVAAYRNGADWLVRFDSGLRFRRPRGEFVGHQDDPTTIALPSGPTKPPMRPEQLDARQLLEALRAGIAPAQHVRELTIGLAAEQTDLHRALLRAHEEGGAARAVFGEYGFGKSHIVEWTSQTALEQNFLVAAVSLDLYELPPHRAFDIYAALMRALRYPDSDERGLEHLLEQAASLPGLPDQLARSTPVEVDPWTAGVTAWLDASSSRRRKAWRQWLEGGRRQNSMNRGWPSDVRFPTIYRVGQNARQIAYLLSGFSVLARLVGYSGLCVLVDEAESYSLLYPYQRPKAGQFFSAMIYTALRDQQQHIDPDSFPQHRWRDYPLGYAERQSLFFLFTLTHSDRRMPVDEWLDDDQILWLDPHQTPQEIGQFLEKVLTYHAAAYGYAVDDRQRQVRRAAAERLAEGLRHGRLSMRSLVRLSVELYDLLYLYPDYDTALLLAELRDQLQP